MKPAQHSMQYLFSGTRSTYLALLHVHPSNGYVAYESACSPFVHTTRGWSSAVCQLAVLKQCHEPYLENLASLLQGHSSSTILVQSIQCQSLGTQWLIDSHSLGDIHSSTANAFALQGF